MSETKKNPLQAWYRQPKIYIRLPSNGKFYPDGALDLSENGEYPVYAMTAKDELMFKTPDALLSGQSTVEVIKSCVPAIINPWSMPSLDVDAVLMAIRIATYGEEMDVTSTCPSCESENNYTFNLTAYLNKIQGFAYDPVVRIGDLVIHTRPYSYKEMTKTNLKTFEQQRIFGIINDDEMPDEKKLELFNETFVNITKITVDIVAGCISKIDTPDGSTDDQEHIKDFINNAPKEVFATIAEHITKMREHIEMQPQDTKCGECNTEFKMPITMDQSNFFAQRS